MSNAAAMPRFCGHIVDEPSLDLIRGLVARYPQLSRTELAATACELLGWLRPLHRHSRRWLRGEG